MTDRLGVYLHIPFCLSKCAYCDFYSVVPDGEALGRYTDGLCAALTAWADKSTPAVDSVYFGGGTPSLLGTTRLVRLLETVRRTFSLTDDVEITLEANPADDLAALLSAAACAGVNRLSLGVQSALPQELAALGRRHTNADVTRTVADARAAGIENLSVDLMLGLPGQTAASAAQSLAFARSLAPEHCSVYLLKIEPDTPFGRRPVESLRLPDEDAVCALYMQACETLEDFGLRQYEISNFARPGRESRHNLKYWLGAPYLGFGAAAHSFFGGKRFYYPRDWRAFCRGARPVDDGTGGDAQEYLLLRLRLCQGVDLREFRARFSRPLPERVRATAARFAEAGLCRLTDDALCLTRRGFLVSNAVLAALLADWEEDDRC